MGTTRVCKIQSSQKVEFLGGERISNDHPNQDRSKETTTNGDRGIVEIKGTRLFTGSMRTFKHDSVQEREKRNETDVSEVV